MRVAFVSNDCDTTFDAFEVDGSEYVSSSREVFIVFAVAGREERHSPRCVCRDPYITSFVGQQVLSSQVWVNRVSLLLQQTFD